MFAGKNRAHISFKKYNLWGAKIQTSGYAFLIVAGFKRENRKLLFLCNQSCQTQYQESCTDKLKSFLFSFVAACIHKDVCICGLIMFHGCKVFQNSCFGELLDLCFLHQKWVIILSFANAKDITCRSLGTNIDSIWKF